MTNESAHTFLIRDQSQAFYALANRLTVTKTGEVRLYLGRRLVGVVDKGDWSSVTLYALETPEPEPEPEKAET